MGRATEILLFINGDVYFETVTEISSEDENGFGEKLGKELAFNDIREVLDGGVAVSKCESVINCRKHVSKLTNLVALGI